MRKPDSISEAAAPHRRRVGLATLLVDGVTLLILIAVGSVLTLTVTGATQNTFSLLGARATTTLDLLEARMDGQFDPVVSAAEQLSAQFADGRLDLEDKRDQAFHIFAGILTALPQVTAVLYVPERGNALRATLAEGLVIPVPDAPVLLQRQARGLEAARAITQTSRWLPPFWIQAIAQPVVRVLAPVRRADSFEGAVILLVTMENIPSFLEELTTRNELHAFIVYDGDWVLGHPDLRTVDFQTGNNFQENLLPRLGNLDDPAFALLGGGGDRAEVLLRNAPRVSDARVDDDRRRAACMPALKVRVGLHTGPVIVGNIGSANCVNYTVVGDAVNTASCLDSLSKEFTGDEDCYVLISGNTRDHAATDAEEYNLAHLGEQEIRGREGTFSIFQLDGITGRASEPQ